MQTGPCRRTLQGQSVYVSSGDQGAYDSVELSGRPGYAVYYTSSVSGFGIQDGWGGTSFAAPEFNGVTALFDQGLGRVGLLNAALYDLVRRGS